MRDRHLCVDVAVLAEDLFHGLLIERDRVAHRYLYTVFVRLSDVDVRRLGVDADVGIIQLLAQPIVLFDLEDGEHENDQIRRSDDREDLFAAATPAGRALDQSRDVEHLDVRPAVLQHSGVHIERGELVGTRLAVSVRERVDQR